MLKALLIVFRQAVQLIAAGGGGKDEKSFTNDANGALCYERPEPQTAMPLWPLFQRFSREGPAVSRANRHMLDVVSGLGRGVMVGAG